jgi:hypothetical protein
VFLRLVRVAATSDFAQVTARRTATLLFVVTQQLFIVFR